MDGSGQLPSADVRDGPIFARLTDGDPAALDDLLRCHWSPLVKYVRSLLDDPDGAQDIVQDTFLDLWQGRERWHSNSSARALLYRIARSRSLNQVRHKRVRARSGPLMDALQRERRWAPTPLQVLEQAELRSALEEAIETLPPRRREVFILGYLHGCRHAEVGEIMGISVQTARNQMSAALADLRRILEPFLD